VRDTDTGCPLCTRTRATAWLTARDYRRGGKERYQFVRCTACGLIYQHPVPNDSVLAAAYDTGYVPHGAPDSPPRLHLLRRMRLAGKLGYPFALHPLLRQIAALILPARGRTPPCVPGGTLLDVGCGSGGYLLAMKNLGWRVIGVEPNERAAAHARAAGLAVLNSTLEAAPIPPRSVDVVTFWHVIEHLPDPLATLRHARTLLRTGGLLLAEVPNIESMQARLFREYWFHLDSPRHVTMYSARTLETLLQTAGFTLVAATRVADARGWVASLANTLEARGLDVHYAAWIRKRWLMRLALLPAWGEFLMGRGAFIRVMAK